VPWADLSTLGTSQPPEATGGNVGRRW